MTSSAAAAATPRNGKLSAQLTWSGTRRTLVLYSKSGDIMRGARRHAGSFVVDDTLYHFHAASAGEAGYLTALSNASCLSLAFWESRTSGRDFINIRGALSRSRATMPPTKCIAMWCTCAIAPNGLLHLGSPGKPRGTDRSQPRAGSARCWMNRATPAPSTGPPQQSSRSMRIPDEGATQHGSRVGSSVRFGAVWRGVRAGRCRRMALKRRTGAKEG